MQNNSSQIHNQINTSQQYNPLEPTFVLSSPLALKHWHFKPRKTIYTSNQDIKKKKKYNTLHWNNEENHKYAVFLCSFIDLAKSSIKQKRKYHLNRMLSKYIGTRSPTQCRSHHQKMLRSFGSLQGIVGYFFNQNGINDDKSTKELVQNSEQNEILLNQDMESFSIQQKQQMNLTFQNQQSTIKIINPYEDEPQLWDIFQDTLQNNFWIIE